MAKKVFSPSGDLHTDFEETGYSWEVSLFNLTLTQKQHGILTSKPCIQSSALLWTSENDVFVKLIQKYIIQVHTNVGRSSG